MDMNERQPEVLQPSRQSWPFSSSDPSYPHPAPPPSTWQSWTRYSSRSSCFHQMTLKSIGYKTRMTFSKSRSPWFLSCYLLYLWFLLNILENLGEREIYQLIQGDFLTGNPLKMSLDWHPLKLSNVGIAFTLPDTWTFFDHGGCQSGTLTFFWNPNVAEDSHLGEVSSKAGKIPKDIASFQRVQEHVSKSKLYLIKQLKQYGII